MYRRILVSTGDSNLSTKTVSEPITAATEPGSTAIKVLTPRHDPAQVVH